MGTASINYRCPSCQAASDPAERRCASCGFEPDAEAQTWVVESHDTPVPERRASRFDDRYDLIEEVGRGGMGIVYKAVDRELDEVIALKVLAEAASASPDHIARFKHEVKVARRLTHPNVARLHDLIEVRGQLCLSMEFIEGRSLRSILDEEHRLAPERVIRYLRYLIPALDLAHSRGIVHRDLKPGNVVIDPRDIPHILDFGIAKSQWLQENAEGSLVGTPGYMGPEQWTEGAEIDGRADLYSLGIMLYEMLAGRRPFEHRNRLLLMEMHRSKPAERIGALLPDIPRDLETVVMRLLEKEPDKRFARAGDILEILDPPEPARKSGTFRRRHISPAPASGRPRGSIPPVTVMPSVRGKILVVDDDASIRKLLGMHLKLRQFLPVEAADGGQALESAYREQPDLILLDVNMPVLDGVEVLRLLKNDERTREVPVVVMSGMADKEQVAFYKESGAASFLKKPITTDVLELVLDRFFG